LPQFQLERKAPAAQYTSKFTVSKSFPLWSIPY
jgi:hypothetical protein